jgi:hypothetical protein
MPITRTPCRSAWLHIIIEPPNILILKRSQSVPLHRALSKDNPRSKHAQRQSTNDYQEKQDMPISEQSNNSIPAIMGENTDTGDGVVGKGREHAGVVGESTNFHAIVGTTQSPNNAGVFGTNSAGGAGVAGVTHGAHSPAVLGENVGGGFGVLGKSHGANDPGVFGHNDAGGMGVLGLSELGVGIFGRGHVAGRFEGDVEVTGDIRLTNADCAEDFDVIQTESAEPGTVMVLGDEGVLRSSHQPYDKRVAGVISGAGDYKPGIVLDKQRSEVKRQPIALLGKVYCKVDAGYASVEVGDLLTTSDTPGHAMKATDPLGAFGAVIGKALRPLKEGQGLVPILIALQ